MSTTSQLVRMPDQFTPGRGAHAAATPTCSSCCCCCCAVSTITATVVLPVSASRAIREQEAAAVASGQPPGQPRPSPARRGLGYLALAMAPLVAVIPFLVLVFFGADVPGWGALIGAVAAAMCVALVGDWLVGHPLRGFSALMLVGFAAMFAGEVFLGAMLVVGIGYGYFGLAAAALAVLLLVYLQAGRGGRR